MLVARGMSLSNQLCYPDVSAPSSVWPYLSVRINADICVQANVMLEYPIEEAADLLIQNKKSAEENLLQTNKSLDWVRDQNTTLEVNMARIYNWDVKERRKAAQSS